MLGLRSLRNRLAVVFGLIVLGAIGTIYLTVTPRLEERLQDQKLDRLTEDAQRNVEGRFGFAARFDRGSDPPLAENSVNPAATAASAEVLILENLVGTPPAVALKMDSAPDGGIVEADVTSLSLDAVEARRPVSATEATSAGRQALVAYPLIADEKVKGVAVFADSLDEVEGNVALIRRQILLSGGIALVIALMAGYLVARALSQRVGRLEQAARKVAAGDFSNPIRADSDDELGQLAAAFDDMQNQLAREVAAEFPPAAQRHDSSVRLELADEPIELDCDPERVAQVLRILLDNALVHTPAGTGVRVSATRRNGHVRLEVSDRGLGIKRQNMPHIFEPFFTSNDEAQGAGLGLAIARELAERMHGELTVRSAPGRTTFSLELPACHLARCWSAPA